MAPTVTLGQRQVHSRVRLGVSGAKSGLPPFGDLGSVFAEALMASHCHCKVHCSMTGFSRGFRLMTAHAANVLRSLRMLCKHLMHLVHTVSAFQHVSELTHCCYPGDQFEITVYTRDLYTSDRARRVIRLYCHI